MASKNSRPEPFRFQGFSEKQVGLVNWWLPESEHSENDIVIADGSVRAGKTIAMIFGFLLWSLAKFRGENFILSSKTIASLERNVLNPMGAICSTMGWDYGYERGENRHVRIGRNTYYCFGANTEKSQDVVQGLTAAGMLGDEAALYPESFRRQAMARCSVEGSRIWLNCNPEGPFHPIKTELIDQAEAKRVHRLHFTMDDNLSLSAKVKERYERMFSGLYKLRFIDGLWVLAEGLIWGDSWSEDLLFTDATAPLGLFSGNHLQRFITCDYGTTNSLVFQDWIDDGETLWCVREWVWNSRKEFRQKTDVQYADDFLAFVAGVPYDFMILDPSAASFKVELRLRGVLVKDAVNDVLDGIRITATMMHTKRLRIHESCTNLIGEIQTYAWDEKAAQRGEEKPIKKDDHSCDACRYGVATVISPWRLAA